MTTDQQDDLTPDERRRVAIAGAEQLAEEQAGVITRRQLYAGGVTRWQVKARLGSRRWQRTGPQTVCITTGPLCDEARLWVAVLETGPRAALGGVTALIAAGLKTITEAQLHVIVPKSCTPLHPTGVRVHESRRFREQDVLTNGIRRVRPPVAVVHAFLWATSDRQAALFLVAPIQQGLVLAVDVQEAAAAVRRHPRRKLLHRLLADVIDGAQSLQELDFTGGLRRRGLPQPSRQVVVQLPGGRVYLDVDWEEYQLSVELDGGQHAEAATRLADTLRDLDAAATGRTPLRIPLLSMRLDEDAILDRLGALLRTRGWAPAADAA